MPPPGLSPRHQLAALLMAIGRTRREIADALGLTEGRLTVLQASPLFQALVAQEQGRLRDALVADVADRLNREAGRTLDRLIELRDQPADLKVALGASNSLADRVPALSRRTVHEETRTANFRIITDSETRDFMRVMLEDEGRHDAVPALAAPAVTDAAGVSALPPLDDVLAATPEGEDRYGERR